MISQSFFYMIIYVLLLVVLFIVFGELIIFLLLKHVKNDKVTKLFGIFMELSKIQIFNISISLIKYIFIMYCLFISKNITTVHLYFLAILCILFGISSLSFKNFVVDALSLLPLYLGLVCRRLFIGYLNDVMNVWYISLGNILLTIFIILYSSFFLLKYINDMLLKNSYVRRLRNND